MVTAFIIAGANVASGAANETKPPPALPSMPIELAIQQQGSPTITKPPPALEVSLTRNGVHKGDPVFIRIFKEEKELELWIRKGRSYILVKIYPVCSWSGKLGPKLKEGDLQSPEGFYEVGLSQLNPKSAFLLSFNLGFPNAYDRAHNRTGSYLMVHGDCVSIGCYAMTDSGIIEIYGLVKATLQRSQRQVPVHVFPFRMNSANIDRYRDHIWIEFWRNLKQGYDVFEASLLPPRPRVSRASFRKVYAVFG